MFVGVGTTPMFVGVGTKRMFVDVGTKRMFVGVGTKRMFHGDKHTSKLNSTVFIHSEVYAIRSLLLPFGHPAELGGFAGCIDLSYLRHSLTNIRIRVFVHRPSLVRENAS